MKGEESFLRDISQRPRAWWSRAHNASSKYLPHEGNCGKLTAPKWKQPIWLRLPWNNVYYNFGIEFSGKKKIEWSFELNIPEQFDIEYSFELNFVIKWMNRILNQYFQFLIKKKPPFFVYIGHFWSVFGHFSDLTSINDSLTIEVNCLLNCITRGYFELSNSSNWILGSNTKSNVELNHFLAKFKHWIESDRVSLAPNLAYRTHLWIQEITPNHEPWIMNWWG